MPPQLRHLALLHRSVDVLVLGEAGPGALLAQTHLLIVRKSGTLFVCADLVCGPVLLHKVKEGVGVELGQPGEDLPALLHHAGHDQVPHQQTAPRQPGLGEHQWTNLIFCDCDDTTTNQFMYRREAGKKNCL